MTCRSSSRPAASPTPRRPATRPTIFSPRPSRPRRSAAARCWSRAATATRSSSPPTRTTILFPVRAGEMARIGPAEVRERYGVDPEQVPDFIALRGDPSDKLPGAPDVGPAGAASLLKQVRHAGSGARRRALRGAGGRPAAVPLDRHDGCAKRRCRPSRPQADLGRGGGLARRWELKQLAERLDELAASEGSGAVR